MRKLNANMAVLVKEAAAALSAVESQQQRLTLQRLVAMSGSAPWAIEAFTRVTKYPAAQVVSQVLGLVPKESESENFEDALARVCRCIGGGTIERSADSDSDLEVVAESNIVNLCCLDDHILKRARLKGPGTTILCAHPTPWFVVIFLCKNRSLEMSEFMFSKFSVSQL